MEAIHSYPNSSSSFPIYPKAENKEIKDIFVKIIILTHVPQAAVVNFIYKM